MFPAIKRALLMPFIERNRRKALLKNIRNPQDILIKMQDYHNLSLEFEKKGRKDLAKEYQVMADALGWALRLDGTSK